MFISRKFVMSTFGAIAALIILTPTTTSTLAIGSPWDNLHGVYSTASTNDDGSPWDGPNDDGSPWDGPGGGSPRTV